VSEPWHVAKPKFLAEVISTIATQYPDIVLLSEGTTIVLRGAFPLLDVGGIEITRFAISIQFPFAYPDDDPIVRETFGRIPPTLERHVNPDGSCCLGVPQEWAIMSDDHSFGAFMSGPVRNYFLGQALVEQGKPWPFGERPHGSAGGIEAYGELLAEATPAGMHALLNIIHRSPRGHLPCPCGSGSKFRNCHLTKVRSLEDRVTRARADKMAVNLRSWTGQNY
jgi:hypothetical protein